MMFFQTPHVDSEVPSGPEKAAVPKKAREEADDEQSWEPWLPRSLGTHPKASLVIGGHKHWPAHEDVEHGHGHALLEGLGARSFVMHKRHFSTWRGTGSF